MRTERDILTSLLESPAGKHRVTITRVAAILTSAVTFTLRKMLIVIAFRGSDLTRFLTKPRGSQREDF